MKRIIYLIVSLLLLCVTVTAFCACSGEEAEYSEEVEYSKVEPFGEVPEKFKSIIENNAFKDVTVFSDRLLKYEITGFDDYYPDAYRVAMTDLYGEELASHELKCGAGYHIEAMLATEDGGFLFVLGFEDFYLDQYTRAGDNGFTSRVIKCGKDGTVQFDTPFENIEGDALEFVFEKNGNDYLFGQVIQPGKESTTDIIATALDGGGRLIKSRRIAGSDFDWILNAEMNGGGFVLSAWSQSDDGDFKGSESGGYPVRWVLTLGEDLETTDKKRAEGRFSTDKRVGVKNGEPVYRSDPFLKDSAFDGDVTAFIDYGDNYLVVTEHPTGVYETPLVISTTWTYRETVYSYYSAEGGLIFRAAVDSTPLYETSGLM